MTQDPDMKITGCPPHRTSPSGAQGEAAVRGSLSCKARCRATCRRAIGSGSATWSKAIPLMPGCPSGGPAMPLFVPEECLTPTGGAWKKPSRSLKRSLGMADAKSIGYKPPFVWFGGKSAVASVVWKALET